MKSVELKDYPQSDSEAKPRNKRARRKRKDAEGRVWMCSYCHRGYLKMESLVHHIKLKHMNHDDALAQI